MFFNAVSNGEGTSYVPTALGSALMAVVFCALLGGALYLIAKAAVSYRKKSEGGLPAPGRLTPKKLAFCAVAVALGIVLSNVKLFHFPTGGSITLLSMLVVCLPGYWFGLGAGLTTGLSYGLLQLVTNPYVVHPAQLVIEYFLAFGSLGLSGIFFREKNGLQKGYAASILGRWFFASLSGWIFFKEYAWEGWNPLLYSFAYNAIYILSEAAISLLLLALPPIKGALAKVRNMALEK